MHGMFLLSDRPSAPPCSETSFAGSRWSHAVLDTVLLRLGKGTCFAGGDPGFGANAITEARLFTRATIKPRYI